MRKLYAKFMTAYYNQTDRKIYISVNNVLSEVKQIKRNQHWFCIILARFVIGFTLDPLACYFAFVLFHEIGHSIQDQRGELDVFTKRKEEISRRAAQYLRRGEPSDEAFEIMEEDDKIDKEADKWPNQFAYTKLCEAKRRGLLTID